jgi:hypothetical protein
MRIFLFLLGLLVPTVYSDWALVHSASPVLLTEPKSNFHRVDNETSLLEWGTQSDALRAVPRPNNSASTALDGILSDEDSDRFWADHFGKSVMHVPAKVPATVFEGERYTKLVEDFIEGGQEDVELMAHPLIRQVQPVIQVMKQGTPQQIQVQSAFQAASLLEKGNSLIVNNIQNLGLSSSDAEPLTQLMLRLTKWNFPDLGVNMYMGGPGSSALDPHTDKTDTIILQVSGHKTWRLCVPTPNKMDQKVINSQDLSPADLSQLGDLRKAMKEGCATYSKDVFSAMENCQTIEMKQGDFLYVPKVNTKA